MSSAENPLRAILIAIITCASLACSRTSRDADLRRRGDEIVTKVEQFRRDSARLPRSLPELGIEEKEVGPIHYEKRSDTSYVVWFGATLGESVIWDSGTRRWDPPARR